MSAIALVPQIIGGAKSIFGALSGGTPKPLLLSISEMQAIIAGLTAAERAQLQQLIRPFDWSTSGTLEQLAGKIAAELRDARKPAEQALYNFIAARAGGVLPGSSPVDERALVTDELRAAGRDIVRTGATIAREGVEGLVTGVRGASAGAAGGSSAAGSLLGMPSWFLPAAIIGFVLLVSNKK